MKLNEVCWYINVSLFRCNTYINFITSDFNDNRYRGYAERSKVFVLSFNGALYFTSFAINFSKRIYCYGVPLVSAAVSFHKS